MFKIILISVIVLFGGPKSWGSDLTSTFQKNYDENVQLSDEEINHLKNFDFFLVPGILSESFIRDDDRSGLDFSFLTKDYFSAQLKFLSNAGFNAQRIKSSSYSVEEIKENIRKAVSSRSRKAFFITHSLGGLALLEEIVSNHELESSIGGIIFIQSPFSGSPVADTYLDYPYHIDKLIKPILPFFNTSEATITYLSTPLRTKFMEDNQKRITELLQNIPVITVAGIANRNKSLFKPSIDLIESGCVKGIFKRCITKQLYQGPYQKNDGMVPFESSKLMDSDFIRLEGADHGETVVSIPFGDFKKESVLVSLLKLILPKLAN